MLTVMIVFKLHTAQVKLNMNCRFRNTQQMIALIDTRSNFMEWSTSSSLHLN